MPKIQKQNYELSKIIQKLKKIKNGPYPLGKRLVCIECVDRIIKLILSKNEN